MRRASSHLHRLAAAALFGLGAVSCGASIQAVYEGDVRFEHCMALDAKPEIKPTVRRACWDEWRKYYTFGQTLDRTEYAAIRERQLNGASDFDEGEWVPAKVGSSGRSPSADPTSILAPPPMLMAVEVADAGVDAPPDVEGDAAPTDAASDAAPPAAGCAAECEQAWSLCRGACKASSCEKECSTKYKRCMKRCF